MRLVRMFLWSIAVATVSVTTSYAETLTCQMENSPSTGNWVYLNMVFEFERGNEDATVHVRSRGQNTQFAARVDALNDRRVTFIFDELGTYDRRGQYAPRHQHRVTYYFRDHSARTTVVPLGFSNRFTARGSCQLS